MNVLNRSTEDRRILVVDVPYDEIQYFMRRFRDLLKIVLRGTGTGVSMVMTENGLEVTFLPMNDEAFVELIQKVMELKKYIDEDLGGDGV